ncbi:MAG: hemerythrin domain-containing protein [Magnetococcales bacterium]|nr:hemerythrin domain-containing protein [Magnetococcales bacterium]
MPEKFILQHPAIDMQHEVLFVLYNELLHTLQSCEDEYDLADIFLGLNVYVVSHFQFEEDAMLASGYDEREKHMEGHSQLRLGVGALHARFLAASSREEAREVAQAIADFLLEWLENHIAKVDRRLTQYLLEQSVQ